MEKKYPHDRRVARLDFGTRIKPGSAALVRFLSENEAFEAGVMQGPGDSCLVRLVGLADGSAVNITIPSGAGRVFREWPGRNASFEAADGSAIAIRFDRTMCLRMRYSPEMTPHQVLCEGDYLGYRYIIASRGLFPCAYIEAAGAIAGIEEAEECPARLGGRTAEYLGPLGVIGAGRTYVGWSFAHASDYFGDCPDEMSHGLRRWETKEILAETLSAIEDIRLSYKEEKE